MQVPAPFDYARARSVDDAIALLEEHGEEARLVAGGHSLLPMMKLGLASLEMLIDINDLTDLTRIWVEGDVLRIGAMVRHADLLASAVVGEQYRMLHEAERVIADPVVRNRGTIGGSLCHADPAEDLSAALGALRAECVVRGSSGERVVPLRELTTGPYRDRASTRGDSHRGSHSDSAGRRQRVHESRATGGRLGGRVSGRRRMARRRDDLRGRDRPRRSGSSAFRCRRDRGCDPGPRRRRRDDRRGRRAGRRRVSAGY